MRRKVDPKTLCKLQDASEACPKFIQGKALGET